jgi:hypothetical protein
MEYKKSIYHNYRNGYHTWVGKDSEELFEENCKKYPDSRSLNYYKKNPIEYQFNNYGFRTPDDFNDTDEGNVFLGCSQTIGIGLHLENTWAYKVNQEVGGKLWNLGQGGMSIQTDYRLLFAWKDTLKIKNIFQYSIPWPRFEFFNEDGFIHLNHHKKKYRENWKHKPHRWEFYVDILSDEVYCNYNQMVYINAIKGISEEIGCNYYYITPEILEWSIPTLWEERLDENDDSIRARDLEHYTVGRSKFLYENMMEYYEEKT